MFTNEMKQEAIDRPDSIWLSLKVGKNVNPLIINWDQIQNLTRLLEGNDHDEVIIVGIPLYGSSEDVLHDATMYAYNLIEIAEKTKVNKEIFEGIGNDPKEI